MQWWLSEQPDADVVMLHDGDLLVGWAVRIPDGDTGYYVRASERRKGYGSFLYYTLNAGKKRPKVYEHNEKSAKFFYSLGLISKESAEAHAISVNDVKRKRRSQVLSEVRDKIGVS